MSPHPRVTASSTATHGASLLVRDETDEPSHMARRVQESTGSEWSHVATHWVVHSSFIRGKYLDQPLRVTSSDLKIFLPPLFSIDQKKPCGWRESEREGGRGRERGRERERERCRDVSRLRGRYRECKIIYCKATNLYVR